MLIKNVYIENSEELLDIRVEDGKFAEIAKGLEAKGEEEVLDLDGKLLLPPFVEPHVHLDSALTSGDPRFNSSGTLFEGIDIWSERKPRVTHEDAKQRALAAIRKQVSNGTQFVRSHVDVTDPNLTALKALIELRDEIKDDVVLQVVAFPQEGILSFPNGKELVEEALKLGADAVGAIPHYEFTREYSVESLNFIIDLALKYDRLVDVHCDEIDDPASRGLETLATRALETGLKGRVNASHTTAMHSYNNAYFSKLTKLLGLSEINFVCNPLVNTHLQGRIDTYPKRRGTTRVPELLANGNNVAFGHDDIQDPWYPMGDGNAMDVVRMGVHVTQMMGYEQLMDSYKMISTNGAKVLNVQDQYGIEVGKPANFIILNAKNWFEAMNLHAEVLYSYHNGKKVAETKPRSKSVLI